DLGLADIALGYDAPEIVENGRDVVPVFDTKSNPADFGLVTDLLGVNFEGDRIAEGLGDRAHLVDVQGSRNLRRLRWQASEGCAFEGCCRGPGLGGITKLRWRMPIRTLAIKPLQETPGLVFPLLPLPEPGRGLRCRHSNERFVIEHDAGVGVVLA